MASRQAELKARAQKAPRRLWHDDRHEQLLTVAEQLVSARGWDGLSLPELAVAAEVTRPIVYKHFRTRRQLTLELVRRYAADVQAMLNEAVRRHPDQPNQALRLGLDGLCDLIETRGAGVWNLLTAGGPDPGLDRELAQLREELMRPWIPRIRAVTGLPARLADVVGHLTLSAVRTAIDRWAAGQLSRREAERVLLLGVGALLEAFSREKD